MQLLSCCVVFGGTKKVQGDQPRGLFGPGACSNVARRGVLCAFVVIRELKKQHIKKRSSAGPRRVVAASFGAPLCCGLLVSAICSLRRNEAPRFAIRYTSSCGAVQ